MYLYKIFRNKTSNCSLKVEVDDFEKKTTRDKTKFLYIFVKIFSLSLVLYARSLYAETSLFSPRAVFVVYSPIRTLVEFPFNLNYYEKEARKTNECDGHVFSNPYLQYDLHVFTIPQENFMSSVLRGEQFK